MHTVHNEWYQLTVSSMHLFFCRCSSTLLSRPDCFFSCSLVTQGNKPGKFIHSSLLDGPPLSSVNTFPHFFYRFITTFLTSTNEMVRQGYWSNDVCGLTCIECHSVKCVYTYMYIYIYIYTQGKSLWDFLPLQYSSRDGHTEGEHVNRGRHSKFLSYLTGARYVHPW